MKAEKERSHLLLSMEMVTFLHLMVLCMMKMPAVLSKPLCH